jgi:hypothetical protein
MFYSIVPIILSNELPPVLAYQMKVSNPDILVYNGSKTQLDEVAHSYPELKHIIWVSPESDGRGEPDAQFNVGGDVSVIAWHRITCGGSSLPDGKSANTTPDIVMF